MFTAAWLTLIMLFAVGTVPFQPLQTVGLCLLIMASYVFFVDYASMASAGVPLDHLVYLGLVGLLCSAMSSALYEGRYAQYRSKRKIEQMQDQLVQKEKLASLGSWTAGIAHEIKNPLNFVNNFAKLSIDIADELDEELAATPEHSIAEDGSEIHGLIEILKTNARKILEHGQRADRIVHGMLLHARGAQGTREPTDLNGLLRLAAEAAEDGFRSQYPDAAFNLEIHLDPSITNVPVVAESIIQVVINLLDNAFYASAQSGAGGDGAPPLVELRTRSLARAIEVRVTDSGIGMDAKAMSSVFDPFFTTKPPGEGTGLGLSMSYSIVQAHRGDLRVKTEAGQGTTFTIELPRAPDDVDATEKTIDGTRKAPDFALKQDKATVPLKILIVDDEKEIRGLARRFLIGKGHEVTEAATGREALKLVTANDYDGIVLDLRMPDLSGEGFFQWLRKNRPHMATKVTVISGDFANPRTVEILERIGQPYLLKPFKTHDLLAHIEANAKS